MPDSLPSLFSRLRRRKLPEPTPEDIGTAMMDTIVAFNEGEAAVAKLIGAKKAREMFAAQEEVAACRRRAATNRDLLDMRLD